MHSPQDELSNSKDAALIYGVCVGPSCKYASVAKAGVEAVDPGAALLVRYDQRSIHEAYNSMIDQAKDRNATGLVLIHDDVRIRDPKLPTKLTSLLADPTVGVVGVIGARRPMSAEWWWYERHGCVEDTQMVIDFGRGTVDVDVVDGLLLALSPAALEIVRFEPDRYPGFHGYDLEVCSQARAAGLRVVVLDTDVYHDTYPHGKIRDRASYLRADRAWRSKWRHGLFNSLAYRRAVALHDHQGPRKKARRMLSR